MWNSRKLTTKLIHKNPLDRAGTRMGSSRKLKTAMTYKHWCHMAKKGLKFHAYSTLTKRQSSLRFFTPGHPCLSSHSSPQDALTIRPCTQPSISVPCEQACIFRVLFLFPQESLVVKQIGNLAINPSMVHLTPKRLNHFIPQVGFLPSSYSMGMDSDSNHSMIRWRQTHRESRNSTKATQSY